jgi:steroid delta-isomerase-like uncharacterized protein
MSVDNNVAVVRCHFNLFATYDETIADAIWAEDILFHEPHQVIQGRDAAKARSRTFRDAFSDSAATVHEEVAQDDKVAARYTLVGTHQAPFAGIPASGKRVTLSGIAIFRLVDGRIVEGWGCADFLGFLQQTGGAATVRRPRAMGDRGSRASGSDRRNHMGTSMNSTTGAAERTIMLRCRAWTAAIRDRDDARKGALMVGDLAFTSMGPTASSSSRRASQAQPCSSVRRCAVGRWAR